MNKYTFTCSKRAFISPYFFHKTLLVFLFLATKSGLWGQTTYDWLENAPDGNWKQGAGGARWNPGGLWDQPGFGILRFNNNHQLSMTNNVTGTYSQHSIIFGSSNTSNRTIGGNTVRFYDNSTTDPKIENLSSGSHTINFNIEGDGTTDPLEMNPTSGNLTFGGTVNNQGTDIWVFGNNGHTITYNGVISGAGKFILKQNSKAVFNATNTYTGNTELDAGELWIGTTGDAIASGSSIYLGNGSSLSTSTKIFLSKTDGGTTFSRSININSGNSNTRFIGSLNTSGTNTFSGNIVRSSSEPLDIEVVNSGGTLALSGIINGSGAVTKVGSGIAILSGANSYSGLTTVSAGTLQLNRTGGTTIPTTNNVTIGGGTLRISTNQTVANLTLSSGTLQVDAGVTLTVTGTYSGSGGTINNLGTIILQGSSTQTFPGTVTINNGTASTMTNLTINNTSGVTNNLAYTVSGTLTVNAGSNLNLSTGITSNATVLSTGATGATISGSGALTLGGNITVNSGSGANGATNSCPVALGANRTFNVSDDASAATDLTVSGVISGAFNIDKAGAGKLVLSNTNTYTGATNVTAGILNVQNAQGTGTTAGGVVVSSGAALELQDAAVGAETLSLAGTGVSSGGALRFISGTNSWAGLITLTAATTVNADAGTNTIDVASGNAITGTFNLTIGGAGNLSIADPIATSTGTLTKSGAGTLTLSGTNTFTGATTISGGTLSISADNNLGTAPASATAGQLTLNGGTLNTSASFTLSSNRGISLGASNGTINTAASTTLTYAGIIAGSGSLTKLGTGVLELTASSGSTATMTGSWFVEQGDLSISSFGNQLNSRPITLGSSSATSGKLLYRSSGFGGTTTTALTIATGGGSIEQNSTSDLTFSVGVTLNGTLSVNCSALEGNLTFSGVMSGSGGLTVSSTNTGALILTNSANTYTGNTTITSGELRLNPSANATFASKIVLNGGTLGTTGIAATRTFTSSSTLLVQENSTIALAASTSHSITFASSALESWTGSKTITVSNWATTAGNAGTAGRIFFTNNTGLGQTQLDAFTFSSYANTGAEFVSSGSSGEITPVNSTTITSSTSGDWNSTGTWVGGVVPTNVDNVIIASTHTVTVTAAASCGQLNFSGTGSTVSVNSGITLAVSGAVRANQSGTQSNAGTITGTGSITCTSVSVGSGGPSMTANRTTTLTSTISTFTSSGTLTLTSRDVGAKNDPYFYLQSGTFSCTDITTVHPSGSNIAIVSLATGAATGTLKLSGSTPFTLDADGTNTITLTGTGATVNYAATGAQTVRNTPYTNLTLSGSGNKTLAAFSISGTLSVEGSAVGITAAPTFGANSTLQYKNVGTRTTNAIEWPSSSGPANLIIDNSGSTVTMLTSAARTLSGNLALTAGTLADNGNVLTVSGNIAGIGTHSSAGSGEILMNGSTRTISGATLGNLELSNAGGYSLSGSPTVTGVLNLANGTLAVGANTLTYSGSSITRTSGNIDASNASATLSFTNGTGFTLPASVFSGNVNNFTLNGAGGVTLGGATNVAGALTLTNGTLTTGANTLTYSGSSISRTNGNINVSNASGTVAFTNTSSLTLPSSLFSGTVSTFTVNGSGGVTLGGNTTMGALNLTSGTLTVGSTNTVTINSGGTVSRTSGALASSTGAGKFSFSGSGTVSGTVGFNDVDIAGAVNFGTAATVNGTLTINAGGWITPNAPLYGPNSLLKYNTGNPANNPYGRGFEWSTTSGAGYPNDVQISNNTTIDYPNSSGSFTTNIGLARDLIIDAGSSLYMDYGSGAASGKLFVGRSVNIAGDLSLGDAIGGDIYVGGDWTRTSGSFNANNRAVFFTGTTGNQTITNASGESFPFVLVDKASGDLVLNNNVTISGGLTLTNGLVDIGNNNVDLLSSTLAGGSPTSYVRTSGTGECRRNLAVGATVLFPVGRSTYNPVELVKSGTQHKFGVRVLDVVTANGQDNGPASTGPNVGRMWDITPAAGYTASNGAVSVNLVYANNLGYFMNGFVNNQPADRRMFHFGPAWVDITGVTGTFESGNYSITNYTYCRQPGVTDFSPFTITNFGAVLPIELVSFQANCKEDNSVSVTWTTASEYNTSHYVVEKSRDGINWSVLGQTAAAGNSTQLLNYEMIDIEKAPGTSYYRLTQFDNDGVFEMFDPVSVNCNGTPSNNHITTYPNPSLDGFYVSLFTETMEGNGQLTITDASGRPVYGMSVNIQDGNNVFHIGDMNAAPGMYYIQVSNGTTTTHIVKHSLR